MQKNIFPEDFFGTPNQYKTIQTPISVNREHPKIINPILFKNKTQNPLLIGEIKEEKCEESLIEISKNKNTLKIIIPHNISNEEISTSGGSNNTPVNPSKPIIQVISKDSSTNNNNNINAHSSLNRKNIQIQNDNVFDENIDLLYPMAFTFNIKEKKSKTIKNCNRHGGYKHNKSFDRNRKALKEIKKRELSTQNKRVEKNKTDKKEDNKNRNKNSNKNSEEVEEKVIEEKKKINNKKNKKEKEQKNKIEIEEKEDRKNKKKGNKKYLNDSSSDNDEKKSKKNGKKKAK